jgi:benzil reductase ((S)-benzoin forming)
LFCFGEHTLDFIGFKFAKKAGICQANRRGMHHYFITGASSGLGKALAEACLGAGHRVTGISRSSTLSHSGYSHITADLSDASVLELWQYPEIENSCDKIVLINNAATIEPVKHVGNAQNVDIIRAYTLNIIAPAVLCNFFLRQFGPNPAAKFIINITSGAAQRPVDGWAVYCSSKAGLDMFTRVAAMERESEKNRLGVVSVAPGIVDTPMQAQIRSAEAEDFSRVEEFIEYNEDGMLTSPEEAARKILLAIKDQKEIKNVVFSVKN